MVVRQLYTETCYIAFSFAWLDPSLDSTHVSQFSCYKNVQSIWDQEKVCFFRKICEDVFEKCVKIYRSILIDKIQNLNKFVAYIRALYLYERHRSRMYIGKGNDSAVENRQLERENDDSTYANCIDIILSNFIYSRKLQ